MMKLEPSDVLIVVDVQNDFCTNVLPVPRGDEVAPLCSKLAQHFKHVILTQDWHPWKHCSFKDQGGPWPQHCVQGTKGAELRYDLNIPHAELIIRKGTQLIADSYSAFRDQNMMSTGLRGYIDEKIAVPKPRIFVCGLALDFCVKETAIGAADYGYETFVVEDCCRAVNRESHFAIAEMRAFKVNMINYIGDIF